MATLNEFAILAGACVQAATLTQTGTAVAVPCRLRGIVKHDTGQAGSVVFRDGGASGATLLTFVTPGQSSSVVIPIPGGGIQFATNVHVTIANVDGVTVFYTPL